MAYPPCSGGSASSVVSLPVDHLHGKGRERDQRKRQVDREDGGCNELVGIRHGPRRLACLLGEVGDRLHARVREHRDRHGEREVRPGGGDAPVDVVDEDRRAEDEEEAEEDEQDLCGEIEDRQHDRELRRLLDADDVQRHEDDDHPRPGDDVPRVRVQRLPEDRQVVRHEERRCGDGDDVHEHLGPGCSEADDLVERMPGKARRASSLRIEDGAFGVRGSRHREDDSRDEEDERCQPKGVDRGEPEGVVDRGADIAVRRCKEGRRPEDSLELDLASPSAGHRGSVGDGGAGARRHRARARSDEGRLAPALIEHLVRSAARASRESKRAAGSEGSRRCWRS